MLRVRGLGCLGCRASGFGFEGGSRVFGRSFGWMGGSPLDRKCRSGSGSARHFDSLSHQQRFRALGV